MVAVAERVLGSVGRDNMWRPGQGSFIRLREGGPGTASQGGSGLRFVRQQWLRLCDHISGRGGCARGGGLKIGWNYMG